jgi:hypothetical protein
MMDTDPASASSVAYARLFSIRCDDKPEIAPKPQRGRLSGHYRVTRRVDQRARAS